MLRKQWNASLTPTILKGLLQECLGSNSAKSKLSFDELEVGNIVDLLLHN